MIINAYILFTKIFIIFTVLLEIISVACCCSSLFKPCFCACSPASLFKTIYWKKKKKKKWKEDKEEKKNGSDFKRLGARTQTPLAAVVAFQARKEEAARIFLPQLRSSCCCCCCWTSKNSFEPVFVAGYKAAWSGCTRLIVDAGVLPWHVHRNIADKSLGSRRLYRSFFSF